MLLRLHYKAFKAIFNNKIMNFKAHSRKEEVSGLFFYCVKTFFYMTYSLLLFSLIEKDQEY